MRVKRVSRTRVLAAFAPSVPRLHGDHLIFVVSHCGAQRTIVPAILGYCTLLGVVIVVFVIVAKMATP